MLKKYLFPLLALIGVVLLGFMSAKVQQPATRKAIKKRIPRGHKKAAKKFAKTLGKAVR